MMNHLKHPLFTSVLVMLILALFLTAHMVSAQEPSPFYWEFINVEIDVQENGDMLVTETQKYVFTAPHTNERYRWIPLDKVDSIENVQVFEGEKKHLVTTGVKNNQQWILWRHELNPPESHIFVVTYRVRGGLQINNSEDRVYWKAIFKERAAPIQRGRVTVRLPALLAGQIRSFKSFGVPADARRIDTRTVGFVSRGALPPGQELEVRISFPHGILNVPVPQWQQQSADKLKVIGFVVLIIVFVVFLIIVSSRSSSRFDGISISFDGGGDGGGSSFGGSGSGCGGSSGGGG